MGNINDELRHAAKNGGEESLESLLLNPKCDDLAKDDDGMTTLMWVARNGHTSCIELLLPVSDALAKDSDGKTARSLATDYGKDTVASLIDAYTLAMSELAALHSSVAIGQPQRSKALRV